jgi:phosphate transport system substrate-binding protein
VYALDDNSGTWDLFNTLVLADAPLCVSKRFESGERLDAAVAADANGIGFVGLPYVKNARVAAISDGAARGLAPTSFSIKTENYVLSWRIYLYTPVTSNNPSIGGFLSFVFSDAGQRVVRDEGAIDIDPTTPFLAEDRAAGEVPCMLSDDWNGDKQAYCQLRSGAHELPMTFHFESDSARLDGLAIENVRRVLDYMASNNNKKIILVGFADSTGIISKDLDVSRKRVRVVYDVLKGLGLNVAATYAFGGELPVRDSRTLDGRNFNRRVEIFVK